MSATPDHREPRPITQRDHMQMDNQSFFDRLRDLAGAEVAEQLQREYGGSQVYVPLPKREQAA